MELTLQGGLDAWDYQWLMSCWMHGGLSVVPKVDQVVNLGFRADATHTTHETHGWLAQGARPLGFPLRLPADVRADGERDQRYWRQTLRGPSLAWRAWRKLRAVLGLPKRGQPDRGEKVVVAGAASANAAPATTSWSDRVRFRAVA